MKNSEPSARGNASQRRRFAKNAAAARNPNDATTHHNAGRHTTSPTATPAPKANAAQNNGRRGGLIAGENNVTSVLGNTSLFDIANRERGVAPQDRLPQTSLWIMRDGSHQA